MNNIEEVREVYNAAAGCHPWTKREPLEGGYQVETDSPENSAAVKLVAAIFILLVIALIASGLGLLPKLLQGG